MGYPIRQGNSTESLMFLMVSAADHITGLAGLVPAVTLSKNGAAFGAPVGAITEVGDGWYRVAPNATDADTYGPLILHATAVGADPTDETYDVQLVPASSPAAGAIVGSYSGDPSASDLDWVRFTIQDTGPNFSGEPWYWADSEINGVIAVEGTALLAAIAILYAWARRIAHSPNFRIGRFSEDWDEAAKTMNAKADELKEQAQVGVTGAYAGAISEADKTAKRANTDRTQSSFRRRQFDNPNAGWRS